MAAVQCQLPSRSDSFNDIKAALLTRNDLGACGEIPFQGNQQSGILRHFDIGSECDWFTDIDNDACLTIGEK